MPFLHMSVASDLDDLHSIENSRVQGVKHVGRAQEKGFAQVDRNIQEVVSKAMVLLWI